MVLKDIIQKLGKETNTLCVTISFNTHRTHPDNENDSIRLKNLLTQAEERVTQEYPEEEVAELLKKMRAVQATIDANYNLDSLHIFLSNKTQEVVRLPQAVAENSVQVAKTFALRPLIKAYSRSASYLIMLLSQGGAQVYEAMNDGVIKEIENDDFPFPEHTLNMTFPDKKSDPNYQDNLIREYFNKVDKAFLKIHKNTDLKCVVVSTTDNYSMLTQVADNSAAYYGQVNVDYNNSAPHQLAQQSWELVRDVQQKLKKEAIAEAKEAVAQGKVQTDLQEIYQSAIDGRGDLLIVHQNFSQPVLMQSERTFKYIDDPTKPGAIDDITSDIAWQVLEKKGRTVFVSQDEIKGLGEIVLKTRY